MDFPPAARFPAKVDAGPGSLIGRKSIHVFIILSAHAHGRVAAPRMGRCTMRCRPDMRSESFDAVSEDFNKTSSRAEPANQHVALLERFTHRNTNGPAHAMHGCNGFILTSDGTLSSRHSILVRRRGSRMNPALGVDHEQACNALCDPCDKCCSRAPFRVRR